MINKLTQFSLLLFFMLWFCLPSAAVAVDFDFIDVEGETHKLSQYRGKWIIVNFWATWCPPCRKEIPDLSDFHLENDDAVVIGVNYEPGIKEDRLKNFIAVYLMAYPVTRVNDDIIEALGEPRGLPTSVLISPQGEVIKSVAGMVSERSLNKLIEQHLSKVTQEK